MLWCIDFHPMELKTRRVNGHLLHMRHTQITDCMMGFPLSHTSGVGRCQMALNEAVIQHQTTTKLTAELGRIPRAT